MAKLMQHCSQQPVAASQTMDDCEEEAWVSSRRPRVLFISHSASRNGATILLLDLLAWLRRRQADWDIRILVHGTGPLVEDFRAIGPTTVCRDPGPLLEALFRGSLKGLRRFVQACYMDFALPRQHFDLVYCNTSAMAADALLYAKRDAAVLWHIHELSHVLHLFLKDAVADAALRAATQFVAVSEAVKTALCSEFQVPEELIAVVNGFAPSHAQAPADATARRQNMRSRLQWPQDAFVVGACGSLGWRKGSDLFLQIAQTVMQKPGSQNVRFLWVGGNDSDEAALEFKHDLRMLGLESQCQLVFSTAEVSDYYCAMDVFALTSREDPFPLVMLEAAAHALPIVCFKETGGGSEFIGEDAGLSAPYLDVQAFAGQIVQLHDSADLRLRLGQTGRQKVRDQGRVEVQGPKILDAMRRCLTRHPRSCWHASACEHRGMESPQQ